MALSTIGTFPIALLIGGIVSSEPLVAQTITIRLLNGKSGRPLSNKNVRLLWSPDFSPPGSIVHFGGNGVATVEIPSGSELFRMIGGPKIGKEPDRIPFIDCNEPMMEKIQVGRVLKNGYVPANTCGKKKNATAKPGEIVFWAMPKPWWQPDMQ